MEESSPGSTYVEQGEHSLSYVVITPARNEAEYIEATLKSMASQTVTLVRWVIVSEGSTAGTDRIVENFTDRYPWIELVRMPERAERHFAGKVHAFTDGYARVRISPTTSSAISMLTSRSMRATSSFLLASFPATRC